MTAPDQPQYTPIPSQPGTYAMILHLSSRTEIGVGKLGRFTFPTGWFVYVGSALGSGGLAGRLKHHGKSTTSPDWRPRWHIDYLRHYAKLIEIWYAQLASRREHDWAVFFQELPGASIAIPRFGSSDCNCPSHLFYFSRHPGWNDFRRAMARRYPDDKLAIIEAGILTSGIMAS